MKAPSVAPRLAPVEAPSAQEFLFPSWLRNDSAFGEVLRRSPEELDERRERARDWLMAEIGVTESLFPLQVAGGSAGGDGSGSSGGGLDKPAPPWWQNEELSPAARRRRRRLQAAQRHTFISRGDRRGRGDKVAANTRNNNPFAARELEEIALAPLQSAATPRGGGSLWDSLLSTTAPGVSAAVAAAAAAQQQAHDDLYIDYTSSEVLLQKALIVRAGAFGLEGAAAVAAITRLLQVYDAQSGSKDEEAAELRRDPLGHIQKIKQRFEELASGVVGAFSEGAGELPIVVKASVRAAASRAKARAGNRLSAPSETVLKAPVTASEDRVCSSVGTVKEDVEEGEEEEGAGAQGKSPWEVTASVAWRTTDRLDHAASARRGCEAAVAAAEEVAAAAEMPMEPVPAWQRKPLRESVQLPADAAVELLAEGDEYAAAEACLASLSSDAHNYSAVQVLQRCLQELKTFPRAHACRADVSVALGPGLSGTLGETFRIQYSYCHRHDAAAAHPARDWIGIFPAGEPQKQPGIEAAVLLGWCIVPEFNEGTIALPPYLINRPGLYIARYYIAGSDISVADSDAFRVDMASIDLEIQSGTGSGKGGDVHRRCGEDLQVHYSYSLRGATHDTRDWLAIVPEGLLDDSSLPPSAAVMAAGATVIRFPAANSGVVRIACGPVYPGRYCIHAFLSNFGDSLAGSSNILETSMDVRAEEAQSRHRNREVTVYVSSRGDMEAERATLRQLALGPLKALFDDRLASLRFVDIRGDFGGSRQLFALEGVSAVLSAIGSSSPFFLCCVGDTNDPPLKRGVVNTTLAAAHPWLGDIMGARGTTNEVSITDIETMGAFLLPALQNEAHALAGTPPDARSAGQGAGAALTAALALCRGATDDLLAMAAPPAFEVTKSASGRPQHCLFYARLPGAWASSQQMTPELAGSLAAQAEMVKRRRRRMVRWRREVVAAVTGAVPAAYGSTEALAEKVMADMQKLVDTLFPEVDMPTPRDLYVAAQQEALLPLLAPGRFAASITEAQRYRPFRDDGVAAAFGGGYYAQVEFVPVGSSGSGLGVGGAVSGISSSAGGQDGLSADGSRRASQWRSSTHSTAASDPKAAGPNSSSRRTSIKDQHRRSSARGSAAAEVLQRQPSAAKRFHEVLADYVEGATDRGLVVVDASGAGTTTALLHFLRWYTAGETSGGRTGVTRASPVTETAAYVPQYGACQLCRVMVSRPRWVEGESGLRRLVTHQIQRTTLFIYIDASCPTRRWTKRSLVMHLIAELASAFHLRAPQPESLHAVAGAEDLTARERSRLHLAAGDALRPMMAALASTRRGRKIQREATAGMMARAWLARTRKPDGPRRQWSELPTDKEEDEAASARCPVPGELGFDPMETWLWMAASEGDVVIVLDGIDALLLDPDEGPGDATTEPDPLSWLPSELLPEVKIIAAARSSATTASRRWHLLRRRFALDYPGRLAVAEGALTRAGIGVPESAIAGVLASADTAAAATIAAGVAAIADISAAVSSLGLAPGIFRDVKVTASRRKTYFAAAIGADLAPPPAPTAEPLPASAATSGNEGVSMEIRAALANALALGGAEQILQARLSERLAGPMGSSVRAALAVVHLSADGLSTSELTAILGRHRPRRPRSREDAGGDTAHRDGGGGGGGGGSGGASSHRRVSKPAGQRHSVLGEEERSLGGAVPTGTGILSDHDWRVLDHLLQPFWLSTLGRYRIRGATEAAVVDRMLAGGVRPPTGAAKAPSVAAESGADSTESPVSHHHAPVAVQKTLYFHALADHFAAECSGIRKALELTSALSGLIATATRQRDLNALRDRLLSSVMDIGLLRVMTDSRNGLLPALLEALHLTHATPKRTLFLFQRSFGVEYGLPQGKRFGLHYQLYTPEMTTRHAQLVTGGAPLLLNAARIVGRHLLLEIEATVMGEAALCLMLGIPAIARKELHVLTHVAFAPRGVVEALRFLSECYLSRAYAVHQLLFSKPFDEEGHAASQQQPALATIEDLTAIGGPFAGTDAEVGTLAASGVPEAPAMADAASATLTGASAASLGMLAHLLRFKARLQRVIHQGERMNAAFNKRKLPVNGRLQGFDTPARQLLQPLAPGGVTREARLHAEAARGAAGAILAGWPAVAEKMSLVAELAVRMRTLTARDDERRRQQLDSRQHSCADFVPPTDSSGGNWLTRELEDTMLVVSRFGALAEAISEFD